MNGLDKIVEEIKAQAQAEADDIINESDNYCEEYMKQVKNAKRNRTNTERCTL